MMAGGILAGALAAAGMAGDGAGIPSWSCSNAGLTEMTCSAGECQGVADFTPMQVRVGDGEASLCAYSACFEGDTEVLEGGRSNLVVRSELQRIGSGGEATLLMLAIDPESGSGTMLWNGFANPLRCTAS